MDVFTRKAMGFLMSHTEDIEQIELICCRHIDEGI